MKSRKAKKNTSIRRLESQQRERKLLLERLEERQLLAVDLPFDNSGSLFVDYQPQTHVMADEFSAPLSLPSFSSPVDIVGDYLENHSGDLGVSREDSQSFRVSSETFSDISGIRHIYLQQTHDGLDVYGAVGAGHLNNLGQVVRANSAFVPLQPLTDATPTVSAADAVSVFADALDITLDSNPILIANGANSFVSTGGAGGTVKADLVWHPTADGLELGWEFVLQSSTEHDVNFRGIVSAKDADRVLRVQDRVLRASYNVFALPTISPLDGPRSIEVDPHDPVASPFGWHDTNGQPGAEHNDTRGNNAFVQEDVDDDDLAGYRTDGGPGQIFNAPFDITKEPIDNQDAAIINAFYITNKTHDNLFNNGFRDVDGNFQATNYSGQGLGGDPMVVDVQDGGTVDNAFYIPSVDGVPGKLSMGTGTLTQTGVLSDSSLENTILIHEYAHGVSTRLAGGPADDAALTDEQPNALGEGWSDFFGLVSTIKSTDTPNTPRPQGEYYLFVNPPGQGIRSAPYCFDLSVCPQNLVNNYAAGDAPHPNGESWAAALFDATWLMINKYGFDPDLSQGAGGNRLMMQLVIEGLKLLPAQPTYVKARDAILAADVLINKGVNLPELWEAFARRGIGFSSQDVLDADDPPDPAFDVPPDNLRAIVTGTTYADINGDGDFNGNDTVLANTTVFIDLNENGRRDSLEPSTISDANGRYEFEFLAPGNFVIVQETEGGFRQTEGAGGRSVIVVNGQDVGDVDFGNEPTAGGQGLGGVVFLDGFGGTTPNGLQEVNAEPGVGGVFVYLDVNRNGRPEFSEPNDISAANGTYSLDVPGPGTFDVRISVPTGSEQTAPVGNSHTIIVGDEVSISGLSFGITGTMWDFGNENMAADGARHRILRGFQLGSSLSGELDVNGDVDDAVVFNSNFVSGLGGNFDIDVATGGQRPGFLHGWIDHDQDPDTEARRLFTPMRLADGTHNVAFTVPAGALTGVTDVFFRYGYERHLGPKGEASAGEVETYRVNVFGDVPIAVNDRFEGPTGVLQDSGDATLDVLANDFSSSTGPILVHALQNAAPGSSTLTDAGNEIEIGPNGSNVIFTPADGFFGTDTFDYTIRDSASPFRTSTAEVTVVVQPLIVGPRANDDYFVINFPTTNVGFLEVRQNDHPVNDPSVRLNAIIQQGAFGTAEIFDNNTATFVDDVVLYTVNSANTPVGTVDSFTYQLLDGNNATDVATVHVAIGQIPEANRTLEVTLGAFNSQTGQPISSINVGQQFELRAFVRDARQIAQFEKGIFSAYFDVSNNRPTLTRFVGSPQPTANYPNGVSGDTLTPNVINEAGAFQPEILQGLGSQPIHIWTQVVEATAAGLAVFAPNPGDNPDLQTLLFDPAREIDVSEIAFLPETIIVTLPGAEGEAFHNSQLPSDTTGDGKVDLTDILVLVRGLTDHFNGIAQGEGESSSVRYLDADGDGRLTVVDALTVLDYLEGMFNISAGGEGEGSVLDELTTPVLTRPLSSSIGVSQTTTLAAASETNLPAAGDRVSEDATIRNATNRPNDVLASDHRFDLELVDRSERVLAETLSDDFLADISRGWRDDEQTP